MNNRSASKPSGRSEILVWLGFLVSPVFYGVLAWIAAGDSENPEALTFSDPLVVVVSVVSLAAFILGSQGERLLGRILAGAAGKGSPVMTTLILKLALFEFIGLAGLVLSLVRSSFLMFMPFMFLSLAGMLISRPGERSGV